MSVTCKCSDVGPVSIRFCSCSNRALLLCPLSVRSLFRSSVRIQIHGLSGYLLLQFWSYSFNMLYDVYTHNAGVHVHRILIYSNILKMTGSQTQSFFPYQLHKGNIVCPANSSYSFRATALIFCMMFINIMEVCMSTAI